MSSQTLLWNRIVDMDKKIDRILSTPPTGAEEIEPKPQDGRRLENRVAALEEAITNTNRLYGLLKGQLDGIDEDHTEIAGQVQALEKSMETVNSQLDDASLLIHPISGSLTTRIDAIEEIAPVYRPCMCPTPSCDGSCEADNRARFLERQALDQPTPPQPAALPLLLDALIAEAETPKVLTRDMISRDQAWREFVAWLRSQKDTTNDQ